MHFDRKSDKRSIWTKYINKEKLTAKCEAQVQRQMHLANKTKANAEKINRGVYIVLEVYF